MNIFNRFIHTIHVFLKEVLILSSEQMVNNQFTLNIGNRMINLKKK